MVKVSVAMITYNHAPYIEQAVRSVLMQETDFEYELIIGEDCSTDATRDIVLDLQQQYPDTIRLLLHESNQGVGANLLKTLRACSGEYIALIEGDDFWTSPHKLQKQITHLDHHPEHVICFHPLIKYAGNKATTDLQGTSPDNRDVFTLADLFKHGPFAHTASLVIRREAANYPAWFVDIFACHYPLLVISAHHGDLGYLDPLMGAYRLHSGGVWTGINRFDRAREHIKILERLDQHFNFQYTRQLKINEAWHDLARVYWQSGDPDNAKKCFKRAVFYLPGRPLLNKEVVVSFMMLFLPRVFSAYHTIKHKRIAGNSRARKSSPPG